MNPVRNLHTKRSGVSNGVKRFFSLILIETFLFTTLGSELAWAKPTFSPQTFLRTRSAASDGSTRKDIAASLHTEASDTRLQATAILGDETETRERIARQIFTPIRGGDQIETVYLGDDLAVYVPRIKGRDPLLSLAEQWLFRIHPSQLGLRRTLESYRLAP